MPYMVHEATYSIVPPFLWQPLRPVTVYRHHEIQQLHTGWELFYYQSQRSISGLFTWAASKILLLIVGFFSLLGLAPGMIALPLVLERNRWMRFALLTCGVFTAGLLMETWMNLHYAAPILPLVLLVAVQSMRQMRLCVWRGHRVGRLLVAASLALCVVSFAGFCRDVARQSRADQQAWSVQRAHMLSDLGRDGSKHLVIVHYGPTHPPQHEWVYNDADIDGARVVWARDMGIENNQELLDYFKDRNIWLLEVDDAAQTLIPYPSGKTRE